MVIMLMLQVLDDPAEDNLHMGMYADHIFFVQIFRSTFRPLSAFGARHICHQQVLI